MYFIFYCPFLLSCPSSSSSSSSSSSPSSPSSSSSSSSPSSSPPLPPSSSSAQKKQTPPFATYPPKSVMIHPPPLHSTASSGAIHWSCYPLGLDRWLSLPNSPRLIDGTTVCVVLSLSVCRVLSIIPLQRHFTTRFWFWFWFFPFLLSSSGAETA